MTDEPAASDTATAGDVKILDTGAEYLSVRLTDDGYTAAVAKANQEPGLGSHLTAGLIDLQVNGFAGVDFNDDQVGPADIERALNAMLECGVTTCLPTIITASRNKMRSRMQALDRAVAASKLGPWMVPGYHLEGPFLNPMTGYAGCHPRSDMVEPSVEFVTEMERDLSRPFLYLTLAPERAGADAVISWAAQRGKIVGIGHSSVRRDDLVSAISLGARISTHLGNGVPQMLHRSDNVIMMQLAEDRLAASFIADGMHIAPHALKVYIRAKGVERSILVTDAVAPAQAASGRYHLGDLAVDLDESGTVRAADEQFLAGSSLTLDRALLNLVTWGIVDFRGALRMACANPLAILSPALQAHGIKHRMGEVRWSDECRPVSVTLGTLRWHRARSR